jgi:MFS transporter, FHS family, L-fucose permease
MELSKKGTSYSSAFVAIVFTFFFWGFVAASNGVLIPMFKKSFSLTQFQSQLVDFAFYVAYFVGSGIYFLISRSFGDPLNKIGYKKGLILGLIISALGALLFIPAVNNTSYSIFLSGLFIIGLGFALLQIVANPFVINLGDPAKGSNRLNLAGGINSLGTTIGPVLLAYTLYGKITPGQGEEISVQNLKTPYIGLSIVLLALAVLIAVIKMPVIKNEEQMEKHVGVFQYPQLVLVMLAIFIHK